MSVYMRAVFAVLPLFVGVSCAFKKDSNENIKKSEDRSAKQAQTDVLSSSEVIVSFIPQEDYQSYVARLSWPPEKQMQFSLRYGSSISSMAGFREELIDARTVKFFDIKCKSGNIVRYEISFAHAQGAAPSRFDSDFNCPTDMRISGDFGDLKLLSAVTGRLYIENQSTIWLKDAKVDLNLIELVILGSASIESTRAYPRNDISDDGKAEVRIQAKRAVGELKLKLRGVPGANGRSGYEVQVASAEYQESLMKNPISNGAGGSPGQSVLVARGRDASPVAKCVRTPGNGGNGQDGIVQGLSGEDGQSGGPSSRAQIAILDNSGFRLSALIEPGVAGKGGAGGPGQPGGLGGPAGSSSDACPAARAGQPGAPASAGKDGSSGAPGFCGEISISSNFAGMFHPFSDSKAQNCNDKTFLKWIGL